MTTPLTDNQSSVFSIELRPAEHVRIHPRQWEAQIESTRHELTKDGVIDADEIVAEAFASMRFVDEQGTTWLHDGRTWLRWAPPAWTPDTPPVSLRPQPFQMELVLAPEPVAGLGWDPDDIPDATDGTEGIDGTERYVPTNLVPASGLPAWIAPDPNAAPAATLDPWLDVMALEWREDGWVQIRCSNDWIAWVDGDLLEPI